MGDGDSTKKRGYLKTAMYAICGAIIAMLPGAIPLGITAYGVKRYRDVKKGV